jgi:hypothetical protein
MLDGAFELYDRASVMEPPVHPMVTTKARLPGLPLLPAFVTTTDVCDTHLVSSDDVTCSLTPIEGSDGSSLTALGLE